MTNARRGTSPRFADDHVSDVRTMNASHLGRVYSTAQLLRARLS
jgi:hypothetical protein